MIKIEVISICFSFLVLFFAIKFIILFNKGKDLFLEKISNLDNVSFNLKEGNYDLCLVGGYTVSNFEPLILNSKKDIEIQLFDKFPKYKFIKNGKKSVSLYNFIISKEDIYDIKILAENLIVKKSMLVSKSYFEKEVDINELFILIKEESKPMHFIISLLLSIVGMMILSVSCFFLLCSLGIIKTN